MKDKSFNIVLVDDSNFAIECLKETISKNPKYNVIATFNNAKDTFKYIESNSIDLLITDMVMPEITGIELSKLALTIKPELPIIITSTLDNDKLIIDAINIGVCDYIKKPFSEENLFSSIERIQNTKAFT
ncbi:MAG: response regulator transcription factor [Bacteriovoracaceae bacterium]|jgi:YesN/AraC family two-component response regulator|nr:response regulator transcription factor [Bacteriovoracaceae bacterium]